ncbi:MAG: methyltransferase domain-containing protein [Gammaproteobacteria bacterium]|nr:methyltransferase domain-containing protein [Gammaproteobacteria bacterium]
MNDTKTKWDRIYEGREGPPARPSRVLVENEHLLPTGGKSLDLACGLGGSALFLAERGFESRAWDVSEVAIDRLAARARELGLVVHGAVRDIVTDPPGDGTFDVIAVAHFLDRAIVPALIAALRPGGLIFYQTFTRHRVLGSGPKNDDFRLADNELLRLFSGLRLLVYREEGVQGDIAKGLRDEAMIVAQKLAE